MGSEWQLQLRDRLCNDTPKVNGLSTQTQDRLLCAQPLSTHASRLLSKPCIVWRRGQRSSSVHTARLSPGFVFMQGFCECVSFLWPFFDPQISSVWFETFPSLFSCQILNCSPSSCTFFFFFFQPRLIVLQRLWISPVSSSNSWIDLETRLSPGAFACCCHPSYGLSQLFWRTHKICYD